MLILSEYNYYTRLHSLEYISHAYSLFADGLRSGEVEDNLYSLSDGHIMFTEIPELLRYNMSHIDFIDEPIPLGLDCPLDLHYTYIRDHLLLALGSRMPMTIHEGVKQLQEQQCDVIMVTLNKSDKEYLPATMYNG